MFSYHSCTAALLIETPDGSPVPVQRSDKPVMWMCSAVCSHYDCYNKYKLYLWIVG